MKKIITLLTILLFVVFMVGCENSINPTQPNNNQDISLAKQSNPDEAVSTLAKGGADKVEICHRKGNGDFITISVAASALQAHLDHGDMMSPYDITGEWEFEYTFHDANGNWIGWTPVHRYDFDLGDGYQVGFPGVTEDIDVNDVSCDGAVSFEFRYTGDYAPYIIICSGMINSDGTMSGDVTAPGLTGTWTATLIP